MRSVLAVHEADRASFVLSKVFGKIAPVAALDLPFHHSGPSKGKHRDFAFVEYASAAVRRDPEAGAELQDAQRAIEACDGKLLRGRKIGVSLATSAPVEKDASRPARSRSGPKPTALSLAKDQRRPKRCFEPAYPADLAVRHLASLRSRRSSARWRRRPTPEHPHCRPSLGPSSPRRRHRSRLVPTAHRPRPPTARSTQIRGSALQLYDPTLLHRDLHCTTVTVHIYIVLPSECPSD